jgi:hypothetical protein
MSHNKLPVVFINKSKCSWKVCDWPWLASRWHSATNLAARWPHKRSTGGRASDTPMKECSRINTNNTVDRCTLSVFDRDIVVYCSCMGSIIVLALVICIRKWFPCAMWNKTGVCQVRKHVNKGGCDKATCILIKAYNYCSRLLRVTYALSSQDQHRQRHTYPSVWIV